MLNWLSNFSRPGKRILANARQFRFCVIERFQSFLVLSIHSCNEKPIAMAAAYRLPPLHPTAVHWGLGLRIENHRRGRVVGHDGDNIGQYALMRFLPDQDAALVLFCSPQQRLSAAFGGAACFGVAVLTKETMLLLLPAVLMLAWTRAARAKSSSTPASTTPTSAR